MSTESQTAKPAPEELIGTVVKGFKIVERIGNSQVFLGFKKSAPTEQIAIKIFFPDPYACNREAILERLAGVRQLEHENIVRLYEFGEEPQFIFAVMEYVPGENLYDMMQRNPRLHWGAAAELARDIVNGLVAAHKKKVLHLCLHPDRILLNRAGQVKINFCNEGVITPSKEVVQYVPPELFLGDPLEASSDIYALGAIIYNIVIGKAPLSGKEPKDVAIRHREHQPVLPSYGVEDIPHSLSVVLSRSLHLERKKRYERAYELQAALHNFLINDIGTYRLGSYKELFKRVEVSETDKSFTRKVVKIQRLVEKTEPAPEKKSSTALRVSFLNWKIIAGCAVSLLANILLALYLSGKL